MCIGDLVCYYFLLEMLRSGQFDHVASTYCDPYLNLVAMEKAVGASAEVANWNAARGK